MNNYKDIVDAKITELPNGYEIHLVINQAWNMMFTGVKDGVEYCSSNVSVDVSGLREEWDKFVSFCEVR